MVIICFVRFGRAGFLGNESVREQVTEGTDAQAVALHRGYGIGSD